MNTFKGFASFLLAAAIVSALSAETHCPGNIAGAPLRFANGYQMIVAVSVNHSGPYNFLLDTGTQFSMVDPLVGCRTPHEEPGFGSGQRNWISYDCRSSAA